MPGRAPNPARGSSADPSFPFRVGSVGPTGPNQRMGLFTAPPSGAGHRSRAVRLLRADKYGRNLDVHVHRTHLARHREPVRVEVLAPAARRVLRALELDLAVLTKYPPCFGTVCGGATNRWRSSRRAMRSSSAFKSRSIRRGDRCARPIARLFLTIALWAVSGSIAAGCQPRSSEPPAADTADGAAWRSTQAHSAPHHEILPADPLVHVWPATRWRDRSGRELFTVYPPKCEPDRDSCALQQCQTPRPLPDCASEARDADPWSDVRLHAEEQVGRVIRVSGRLEVTAPAKSHSPTARSRSLWAVTLAPETAWCAAAPPRTGVPSWRRES